jgi:hypothetical protein
MFHVNHFGTIDDLAKNTCLRRGEIRSGDLDLARRWERIYFWPCVFLENGFAGFGTKAVPGIELFLETEAWQTAAASHRTLPLIGESPSLE